MAKGKPSVVDSGGSTIGDPLLPTLSRNRKSPKSHPQGGTGDLSRWGSLLLEARCPARWASSLHGHQGPQGGHGPRARDQNTARVRGTCDPWTCRGHSSVLAAVAPGGAPWGRLCRTGPATVAPVVAAGPRPLSAAAAQAAWLAFALRAAERLFPAPALCWLLDTRSGRASSGTLRGQSVGLTCQGKAPGWEHPGSRGSQRACRVKACSHVCAHTHMCMRGHVGLPPAQRPSPKKKQPASQDQRAAGREAWCPGAGLAELRGVGLRAEGNESDVNRRRGSTEREQGGRVRSWRGEGASGT